MKYVAVFFLCFLSLSLCWSDLPDGNYGAFSGTNYYNAQNSTHLDPNKNPNKSGEMTIEAYAYLEKLPSQDQVFIIASKADNFKYTKLFPEYPSIMTLDYGYALYITSQGRVVFILKYRTESDTQIKIIEKCFNSDNLITLNKWLHVMCTISLTKNMGTIGLDGVQKTEVIATNATNITYTTAIADFYVGWSPNMKERFCGKIDELRVSQCCRYSQKALGVDSYTIPLDPFTSDTSTMGLWHFDEQQWSSQEAQDSSRYRCSLLKKE